MNAKDILNYIDIQIKVFEAFGRQSDYSKGLIEGLKLVEHYINTMGKHG